MQKKFGDECKSSTVRRYLLSTNMLVIHLLTLSNNLLKLSTKEDEMDG